MNPKKSALDVIGHLASLRRYARSLVRSPSDAEDLVHDALVKAFEHRQTFRSGSSLRNWLLSIVHNTHVDRHRAAKVMSRRNDALLLEADLSYPPSQEHAVRLRQVRDAFMELPQDQREALHLVSLEDLSYQEAADALRIPVGTLMSRVARARERLRVLEEETGPKRRFKIIGGGNE